MPTPGKRAPKRGNHLPHGRRSHVPKSGDAEGLDRAHDRAAHDPGRPAGGSEHQGDAGRRPALHRSRVRASGREVGHHLRCSARPGEDRALPLEAGSRRSSGRQHPHECLRERPRHDARGLPRPEGPPLVRMLRQCRLPKGHAERHRRLPAGHLPPLPSGALGHRLVRVLGKRHHQGLRRRRHPRLGRNDGRDGAPPSRFRPKTSTATTASSASPPATRV